MPTKSFMEDADLERTQEVARSQVSTLLGLSNLQACSSDKSVVGCFQALATEPTEKHLETLKHCGALLESCVVGKTFDTETHAAGTAVLMPLAISLAHEAEARVGQPISPYLTRPVVPALSLL